MASPQKSGSSQLAVLSLAHFADQMVPQAEFLLPTLDLVPQNASGSESSVHLPSFPLALDSVAIGKSSSSGCLKPAGPLPLPS